MRCKDCPEIGGDREACCVAAMAAMTAPDWSGIEARVLTYDTRQRTPSVVVEKGNRRERRAARAKARRT